MVPDSDQSRTDWPTTTSLAVHLVKIHQDEITKGLPYTTLFKREYSKYTVKGETVSWNSLRECYRKTKRKHPLPT